MDARNKANLDSFRRRVACVLAVHADSSPGARIDPVPAAPDSRRAGGWSISYIGRAGAIRRPTLNAARATLAAIFPNMRQDLIYHQ